MYKDSDIFDHSVLPGILLDSGCAGKCNGCNICKKECAFLQEYGNPGKFATRCKSDPDRWLAVSFECSLCGLCTSVCPKQLDPSAMFLEFRREAVKKNQMDFSSYKSLINYERKGTSKKYSYYHLPENCTSIFFPGCSLTGTRPENTWKAYEYLIKQDKTTGIVLDCCTKPSHDLGRQDYFDKMFCEMKSFLLENNINTIIVACPNCHKIFDTYGREFKLETVYDVMSRCGLDAPEILSDQITIHDPCPVRFEQGVQDSVRRLVNTHGLDIVETSHQKETTYCCGEGGAVGCMSPEYSRDWSRKRADENSGHPMATYCAGCVNFLARKQPTFHILDLVFDPKKTLAGKAKVAKAPFTYWNRLKFKKILKKYPAAIQRERVYDADPPPKSGLGIKWLLAAVLITVIAGIQASGFQEYLDQEKLGQFMAASGNLAPLIYMLTYTLAPTLFLPGLPITIAGGILFGPFWGVVYTIIGSTAGAGLAFLISRYVSAGFIESKLRGPKWLRLQDNVEKHGWKVVAASRLIPLFPFNLLNYAFGLTRIKFCHYMIATFICMLPACIAFIVFSSSLLDLFHGKISLEFIIGCVLIVMVCLIPFTAKAYKMRKKRK